MTTLTPCQRSQRKFFDYHHEIEKSRKIAFFHLGRCRVFYNIKMGRISRDNVPLIKLWCTANLFNNVSVFFFLSSYTYLEKNLSLYYKIVKPKFKKETFNHSQLYGSKIVGCLQICFYEKLPLHNLMNLKKCRSFLAEFIPQAWSLPWVARILS